MTQQDLQQISQKGITGERINQQLEDIKNDFPFLPVRAAVSAEYDIVLLDEVMKKHYVELWNQYKRDDHCVVEFVPASGVASRMSKNLYAFLHADYTVPTTDFEKEFFTNLKKFAFYEELTEVCKQNEGVKAVKFITQGQYKTMVENPSEPKRPNYGNLSEGLLLFHEYDDAPHTPMGEHLVEAALYASCRGDSYIRFTVLHQHLELFRQRIGKVVDRFIKQYKIQFHVSLSEQEPSTNTIAASMDNTPFRNNDGALLFKPGGHGVLIENLNNIDADIVFTESIDNVVPGRLKTDTVAYRQVIGGVLIELQGRCFKYLRLLESDEFSYEELKEIIRFVQRDLMCRSEKSEHIEDEVLPPYLRGEPNRPLRVCGMVKDVDEPGGSPFTIYSKDGATSPQILGSGQIDKNNKGYVKVLNKGTHFSPVDLVCTLKDCQGKPFNLPDFVDKETGLVSTESKDGKELEALELPGLWSGAMNGWNTVFVEVPLSTFNPIKTVNDLLREQHQP